MTHLQLVVDNSNVSLTDLCHINLNAAREPLKTLLDYRNVSDAATAYQIKIGLLGDFCELFLDAIDRQYEGAAEHIMIQFDEKARGMSKC